MILINIKLLFIRFSGVCFSFLFYSISIWQMNVDTLLFLKELPIIFDLTKISFNDDFWDGRKNEHLNKKELNKPLPLFSSVKSNEYVMQYNMYHIKMSASFKNVKSWKNKVNTFCSILNTFLSKKITRTERFEVESTFKWCAV